MALDVPREAERSQNTDPVPVHVEFIPGYSVPRRLRNRMVIVVPPFAEGKEGDPQTVFGGIVRQEPPRSPHVRRRVYQPGGVQADYSSQEHSPQEKGPATDRKECYAKHSKRNPMPLGDPKMKLVLPQIGNKGQELLGIAVHGLPRQNPTHVRPQAAILRRVRVTFFVGVLVVDPVRGYPSDWSAFKGKRPADRQKMFHPLRRFVAAVGKQAVVTHANAETSGDPPEKKPEGQRFPSKKEQRGDRADMKCQHEKRCGPINGLRKCFVVA